MNQNLLILVASVSELLIGVRIGHRVIFTTSPSFAFSGRDLLVVHLSVSK